VGKAVVVEVTGEGQLVVGDFQQRNGLREHGGNPLERWVGTLREILAHDEDE
jgi:hypothetical protein